MDKETFCLENFPTSESAKRQLKYVTAGFYDNSYVGKWLYQAMGQEYDDARKRIEELPAQMFVETATWGLMYHEIKWGLPVRENLPYEERRRLIYAKRDYRAPMTPYRMEQYIEGMMPGFEVHIADIDDLGEYGFIASHPNVFKAYFIGEETLDSKLVRKIINRLKQSHTTYTITDIIKAIFDNRDLEKIVLRTVQFRIEMSFWYEYVYNGGWFLDGSVTLDSKRRYGLVLRMEHRLGYDMPEYMKMVLVGFALKMYTGGRADAGTEYRLEAPFWNTVCFDGSWTLDGSEQLNAKKYTMALNMEYAFMLDALQEEMELQTLRTGFQQYTKETAAARMMYPFAANVRETSKDKAKISLAMHAEIDSFHQERVDLTVETKSKDYWFLDGSQTFDGSRNLNSVYGQEEIE